LVALSFRFHLFRIAVWSRTLSLSSYMGKHEEGSMSVWFSFLFL